MLEIDEENRSAKQNFHLAGIVPVTGQALDFHMPWHDCMMPIAPNYTMIERAILECAWAGCETIWVVCPPNILRLLKNKIGNFVYEPVRSYYVATHPELGRMKTFERIPIFFVSVLEKHIGKRESLGFSVLQGAYQAYYVTYKMSKWLLPSMYYVAFPYGVYHPKQLKKERNNITSYKNFLLTSEDGKTVLDNEYLGFTFSRTQFKLFRNLIKTRAAGPDPRLYSIGQIFNKEIIQEHEPIQILNYCNVGSWKDYQNFMCSGQSKYYTESSIIKYFKDFKHTLIGIEEEENDNNI
jgi:hypothetical protein